jgi:chromosome segregation ATPase
MLTNVIHDIYKDKEKSLEERSTQLEETQSRLKAEAERLKSLHAMQGDQLKAKSNILKETEREVEESQEVPELRHEQELNQLREELRKEHQLKIQGHIDELVAAKSKRSAVVKKYNSLLVKYQQSIHEIATDAPVTVQGPINITDALVTLSKSAFGAELNPSAFQAQNIGKTMAGGQLALLMSVAMEGTWSGYLRS